MSATPAPNLQLRAAGLMLASTVAFGLMAICIRLASRTEPVAEIAFFRNLFGLLALLPLLLWPAVRAGVPGAHLHGVLRTTQLRRYFIRCLIGVVSMWMGFWAIAHLPLAQAVSLAYSSPIFVTVAAVLLLGERVRLRRWLAVIAGLTAKTVDVASAFSYPLIFLPFISSAFVPTTTMPGPVRWFAENQPVTSIVDSIRALLAGAPVGSELWVALAWCTGILIVAFALAMRIYRRRIG